jgi:hypothetical protein
MVTATVCFVPPPPPDPDEPPPQAAALAATMTAIALNAMGARCTKYPQNWL